MRLCRGLSKPYRSDLVGAGQGWMFGTDFTDCAFTALTFARGRRGVLLVLDPDGDRPRVSEELWPDRGAKRLMVWGVFDPFVVAAIPAKELRAHVRRKGVVAGSDSFKAAVLETAIASWMANARRCDDPGNPRVRRCA